MKREFNKKKIKLVSLLLSFIMVLSSMTCVYAVQIKAPETSVEDALNKTAQYLIENIKNPDIGTFGGEWSVIGLARSDVEISQDYFEKYYNNLSEKLKETNGVLHSRKYTEYSRAIIAVTAIGKDATNVGGYDLTEKLADFNNLVWQGINGAIWGLIALDCGNYDIPFVEGIGNITTRQKLVDHILDLEIDGGGWSMGEKNPDVDVTAMALQSLAKYNDQPQVKASIDRALSVLSKLQNDEGGFESWGTKNSESVDQVLVALCALSIDPKTDERFVKNNGSWIVSNIIDKFYIPSTGGFKHIMDMDIDGMATDQGFYSLVAYERFSKGKSSLYDMSDVEKKYPTLREAIREKIAGMVYRMIEK